MQNLFGLGLVSITLALSGCAATVQRPAATTATESAFKVPPAASKRVALFIQKHPSMHKSDDWELFRTEWRTAVASTASAAGKQFTYLEVEPASAAAEAGTLIVVTVNDYRYISPGARYGFGIMTGNAFIDADAKFFELPGRRELGARKYSTSSSAWQGIFSAMTDKQVAAIAAEMIKELDR
jgi:hypothetical protein